MNLSVSDVSRFIDGSTNPSLAHSSEVMQVNSNMSALLNRVRRITGLHYRFWTEEGRKDPALPVLDLLCPANLLNRSKLHFDLDLFRKVVATEFEFQPHLNPVDPKAPEKQINGWMANRYIEYCIFPIIFDEILGKTIEKAKSASNEIQQEIDRRSELAAKVLGPSVLKLNESLMVHNSELLECSRMNEIVNNSGFDSFISGNMAHGPLRNNYGLNDTHSTSLPDNGIDRRKDKNVDLRKYSVSRKFLFLSNFYTSNLFTALIVIPYVPVSLFLCDLLRFFRKLRNKLN